MKWNKEEHAWSIRIMWSWILTENPLSSARTRQMCSICCCKAQKLLLWKKKKRIQRGIECARGEKCCAKERHFKGLKGCKRIMNVKSLLKILTGLCLMLNVSEISIHFSAITVTVNAKVLNFLSSPVFTFNFHSHESFSFHELPPTRASRKLSKTEES